MSPYHNKLCVALMTKWIDNMLCRDINLADVALVACDVLLKRKKESLCMLGSEDYAALYSCLRKAWEHCRKVEDKLRCRVSDDCEVAVVALSHLLVELYLNTRFFCFVHSCNSFFVNCVIFASWLKGTKIIVDSNVATIKKLSYKDNSEFLLRYV